jgi:hypothetical protein
VTAGEAGSPFSLKVAAAEAAIVGRQTACAESIFVTPIEADLHAELKYF